MPGDDNKTANRFRYRRALIQAAATSVVAGAVGVRAAALNKPPEATPSDVFDVVIIGAGLSGLTAARDLSRAGCESFVVLEARNRVGGRTFNHDLGHGYFSEMGGQWIGPGQTAIADLLRELDIGTFPTFFAGKTAILGSASHAVFDFGGGFGTDARLAHELEEMSKTVPSGAPWLAPSAMKLDATSVGDWLVTKNVAATDQIGWTATSVLTVGAAPARLSLLYYLSMINSASSIYGRLEDVKGGAQESRIRGGSQIVSIRLAQQLRSHIRLECPVLRIENWEGGPVAVHTSKGPVFGRQIILAMSPILCQQIDFDPPLPELRREMQRRWPGIAPARKVTMVYDKAFWREQGLNGQILQAQGPVLWAWDNSPEDVSFGMISAFVVNGSLPTDPELARNELAGIYARALGKKALNPTSYYDHDWGLFDKYTISCISPMPPGFLTRYGRALHPSVGRLIWSGTETADVWPGYMDGAVRSGRKAALQALAGLV
jgi:monoamine oxidase